MLISVVVNLGMLGYFKYGGFLLENFVDVRCLARASPTSRPSGTSSCRSGSASTRSRRLSYTLDVYLRRAKPAKHFLDYALFVTFFPHLVAGPIMRPTELVPQFAEPRRATAHQLLFRLRADHPRPVPEGRARRRLPRAGGREGLRRARRRPDDARRLGRDARVQRADLLRLRRLFDDRDRRRDVPRLRDARQFPLPLCGGRLLRFLAALAHHLVELAARLSLHSAGRQPARAGAHLHRADGDDAARRPVARRGLDLRRLGRPARPLPGGRALAAGRASPAGSPGPRRSSRSAC